MIYESLCILAEWFILPINFLEYQGCFIEVFLKIMIPLMFHSDVPAVLSISKFVAIISFLLDYWSQMLAVPLWMLLDFSFKWGKLCTWFFIFLKPLLLDCLVMFNALSELFIYQLHSLFSFLFMLFLLLFFHFLLGLYIALVVLDSFPFQIFIPLLWIPVSSFHLSIMLFNSLLSWKLLIVHKLSDIFIFDFLLLQFSQISLLLLLSYLF